MHDILDLDRYPLDQPGSEGYATLVERCRRALDTDGLFNLDGLVRESVLDGIVAEVAPYLRDYAFTHSRRHNIYFLPEVDGLPRSHPALTEFDTVNHTVCADQIPESMVCRIYEWPPLAAFLADVMEKPVLYTMADPLARANVMAYHDGEALNWHFDRSEFTTTLLLQAPDAGGDFQYRQGLRSDSDPNYDGVANLLEGRDRAVTTLPLAPGTLNVFKGKNTAHRVTPVEGDRDRIIAVFSYYEDAGVMFSEAER
ncbi:MAG: 2OG-Fe(II) oxygenase, partial [Pseudomonadota bacterium]